MTGPWSRHFTCPRCGHRNDEWIDSDFGRPCMRCFVDADRGRITFDGHVMRCVFFMMYALIGYAVASGVAVAVMLATQPDEDGRRLLLWSVNVPALAMTIWLWRRRGRSLFLAPRPPDA